KASTGTLGHLTDFGFAPGIAPLLRPAKAVGLAFTVRVPHLDATALHYAMSLVEPGEILVVDTTGQTTRAFLGAVTAYAALRAGVAAVVMDGMVTDWVDITRSGLQVWCRGTTSLTGKALSLEGALQV